MPVILRVLQENAAWRARPMRPGAGEPGVRLDLGARSSSPPHSSRASPQRINAQEERCDYQQRQHHQQMHAVFDDGVVSKRAEQCENQERDDEIAQESECS